ncbi:MAG: hypothetical protein JSU77_02965 [Fidelibacterota bacterium]|nr:MAG: hypothetical protein JSU77_02965 [Candidatus Neomarinimicrobiota bacterium]
MKNRSTLFWRLCWIGAALLCVLTFTPVVIPSGHFTPFVAGMPRTIWTGILVYIGLVLLTLAANIVYKERDIDGGADK